MENIKKLLKVLIQLGYKPSHNIEKKNILFNCPGSDCFPENHKEIARVILGDQLQEFFYGGIDTQFIYYK